MASVKVAVRVRPLSKRELDMRSSLIIHMEENKTLITNVKLPTVIPASESHLLGRERVKQFAFDHSYWSMEKNDRHYASQEQIFQDLGYDVVQSAYQGYNACVFAYGQTGSGKTFTMMGNPEDVGLIPRICQNLFSQMQDENTTYRTEVSYMEIYNERVRDLLREKQPVQPINLRVREHPKTGPYVQDLSKHLVVNYNDIEDLMERGNINRTTAATNMNDVSSRSHAIFTIVFTQAKFTEEIPSEIHSKINLVDLAGSERVDASGATGQRLKEGGSINKSLVTLGNVISTLADLSDKMAACRKNVFIPYRDSVLTWLLKDSLGGNARTIMIATISPADCNYAETLSTLRYASRAKRIINKPTVNEDPNVKLIRELREENFRLKLLLGQNVDFIETQEKLNKNEEKVKQLTEKWTGKWQEAANILQEHKQLALRREGSGVVLDSELPYLLLLDEGILTTGMKLYHLKEGETKIGREDAGTAQDIILQGQYVEAEHCIFTHYMGEVVILPLEGALCSINNIRIHEPTKLGHGAMIRLGRNHMFRFNHPGEVAKIREEMKMVTPTKDAPVDQRGDTTQLLKVCPDYQWTWSTLSVVDSAVGSDVDLEQKSCIDEIEKLEEKRRMIEKLEEEHCLAEAARLAQLAEQEGNKVELEEREEELIQLKEEAHSMKREAEKAQKEIKRLSANIEQQVEEHITYKERLAEEQQRLAAEKEKLEKDLERARSERQRLRKQREQEQARIQIEKERQLQEWSQLNAEKRQLEIKKHEELEQLKKEKTKISHVRDVEKEIYSQAMNEMRLFIQSEVQEMKRLSAFADDGSTEASSIPSGSSVPSELDQLIDVNQLSISAGEEEEEEESITEKAVLERGSSEDLSLSESEKLQRIIDSVTRGHRPGQVMLDSDIQSEMSTSISLQSPDDDGPVLPAKYLEGSPVSELPPQGLGVAGLSDSYTEHTDLSHIATLPMEEITAMLSQLSLQVSDIHTRVCESLTRKYTSILSSDDTTAGLGIEVITRFAHIRPLFEELEKVARHASQQDDSKNLPAHLEHYDRTLTTIDQFLRIHEAVQTINKETKAKNFQQVIENLDRVHILFGKLEVEGEAEMGVYKVLQTEMCILREQLLYHLGETWNALLKWTLPNESRRNANQPRTATLEINEEEEKKAILARATQAMQDMNLLQPRLKTFCDKVMTYFIEAVVQDRNTLMQVVTETNRSILCVVQYPRSASQPRQLVPPGEVFQKLEQIFMFLHKPLCQIQIQESVEGQVEKEKVILVQKFGNMICKRLFDYIFNECLSHAIPRNNKNWDKFNEVVAITEKFQEMLAELSFLPAEHSSLMDYFNNVNSLFANIKSQEIVKQAHEFMTQDLHNSVTISSEYPLGRDVGRRMQGSPMSDELVQFVKKCREEAGTSQQRIPTCQVSVPMRSLVCLAYGTLREAIGSSQECATHLSHSVQNIFDLYCDVVPSYHKDKLTNLPLLAALHHNNCMFVAHHLMTLDKQFRKKIAQAFSASCKQAKLGELVPKIRKLGNDNFTQHIVVKKQQLCDHLNQAEGFDCVADDEGDLASEAVKQMLHHLRHIATIWQDVLPFKVYCKAVGTLLNAAVTEIVECVVNIGEFSADDCECLQKVLLNVADVAVEFFKVEDPKVNPEVLLHECVPNWMKFKELVFVLNSSLQEVADRWADGKGPLAVHFSAEEVRRLVIAMFENTSKRDAVLAQLR